MSGADQSPPRRRDRSASPPRRSASPSRDRDNRRDDYRGDRGGYRGGDRGGRGGGGGGGRPPPREGDWPCPECRASNFERRSSCFKCGTPKPAGVEVNLPWGVPGAAPPGPGAPPPAEPKMPVKKEEPNFGVSGKLTEALLPEKNGVKIKWMEPQEAAKPRKRWRLFPFKGEKALDPIPIYRKSFYLLGRDTLVADIPTEHPSCSGQHAVIQHRTVETKEGKRVRPYIVDLGSKNGTFLLSKRTGKKVRLDEARYYELQERDVLSFGDSTREYVVLNDEMAEKGNKADSDAEAPMPKFV